jgi:hypothetical protein
MHGEQILVPIAFFSMITILGVGIPYVRGLVRRWERQDAGTQIPTDVAARLERMEHAIDAISVEVERISEGQRFTTKLLADRESRELPVGRSGL